MNVQQALNAYVLAHPDADPDVLESVGDQLDDLTDHNEDVIKAVKAVIAVTGDREVLYNVSSLLSDLASDDQEVVEVVQAVLAQTDNYESVYVEAHGFGCECKKCVAGSDEIK